MGGIIFIALLVVAIYCYLRMIARSRSHGESLHQPPDDMRRADDNQRPPYDGSSGWV